jgi:hypothetical protein
MPCDTHPHPCENQTISDFLRFLDEDGEFLPAQFICTKESSDVTDRGLEETTLHDY